MLIILLLIILFLLICYRFGSAEKYLFHGSNQKIPILEPKPSAVINNEKAVFATPNLDDAVFFGPPWTDYDFSFGTVNGKKYSTEQYPGAHKKLNKTVFVHYLPASEFHRDKRLPPNEFISYSAVKPVKIKKIKALPFLKKSSIKFIKFADLLRGLRENKPEKIDKTVENFYVSIDANWKPEIPIEGEWMSENIDDFNFRLIEPTVKGKKYIVIPKKIKYYGSAKTTAAEYEKFIEGRLQIYAHYEKMYV